MIVVSTTIARYPSRGSVSGYLESCRFPNALAEPAPAGAGAAAVVVMSSPLPLAPRCYDHVRAPCRERRLRGCRRASGAATTPKPSSTGLTGTCQVSRVPPSRDVPSSMLPPRRSARWRMFLRPSPAEATPVDALAVVGDDQAQLVPGRDRDHHLRGAGVLADIGQGLPQDGEHLFGQHSGHDRVDRTAERDLRAGGRAPDAARARGRAPWGGVPPC